MAEIHRELADSEPHAAMPVRHATDVGTLVRARDALRALLRAHVPTDAGATDIDPTATSEARDCPDAPAVPAR
jgi:hypothetical protein